MQFSYLDGYILSVTASASEVVIQLDEYDVLGAVDPENLVLNIRLKGCPRSEEVCRALQKYVYERAEIFFQEAGDEKYLKFYIEHAADPDTRLDYAECEVAPEVYTGDLRKTLENFRQCYEKQIDYHVRETAKLRAVINGLRQELSKEIDRFERKSEFFASTDQAEKFEMGRNCYRRALELLNLLQQTEAVESGRGEH